MKREAILLNAVFRWRHEQTYLVENMRARICSWESRSKFVQKQIMQNVIK